MPNMRLSWLHIRSVQDRHPIAKAIRLPLSIFIQTTATFNPPFGLTRKDVEPSSLNDLELALELIKAARRNGLTGTG